VAATERVNNDLASRYWRHRTRTFVMQNWTISPGIGTSVLSAFREIILWLCHMRATICDLFLSMSQQGGQKSKYFIVAITLSNYVLTIQGGPN